MLKPSRPARQPHARRTEPDNAAMRAAYERALRCRINANASGTVVLPTGTANTGEIAQVLRAIDVARAEER
jgi:hypothetical protein